MTNYTNTYACKIITTQWRRVTHFFWKIYLSLYMKGLCVRGSWRPNRTATYWPPHSIGHQRCVFLVLQSCSTGGPGASLSECWFSLPQLVTNSSGLQTHWLPVFTELYILQGYLSESECKSLTGVQTCLLRYRSPVC